LEVSIPKISTPLYGIAACSISLDYSSLFNRSEVHEEERVQGAGPRVE
jgi:hypothetical protein